MSIHPEFSRRGGGSIGYLELSNAGLVDEGIKDLLTGKDLWGLNLTQNEVTVIPPGEAGRLAILDFRDTRIGDDEVSDRPPPAIGSAGQLNKVRIPAEQAFV